jgi:hypothetical protein
MNNFRFLLPQTPNESWLRKIQRIAEQRRKALNQNPINILPSRQTALKIN